MRKMKKLKKGVKDVKAPKIKIGNMNYSRVLFVDII